jgi:ABC-2 type transport system ATP-binding protein
LDNILTCKNVTKIYEDHGNKFNAVTNISFSIKKGQILSLLGPNGAGKTTIVSMIGGYLLPTSGQIFVNEKDIFKVKPNVGVSFGGELGFYGRATAKQNLAFFSNLAKIPHRRQSQEILRVLDATDLTDAMNKKVQFFSKGMMQRLHIARSLLGNPSLLLLDEPTSGLDVEISQSIRKTIKSLSESGVSILLTSHTMSEVEALADEVILLGGGKVFSQGSVAEIVNESGVKHIDRPATLEESYLALAPRLRRK